MNTRGFTCIRCGQPIADGEQKFVMNEQEAATRPTHADGRCPARRQSVQLDINGLGQFHALSHDVNQMEDKMARELRQIFDEWLTTDGADIAHRLPRWQRNIVAAGILHALN